MEKETDESSHGIAALSHDVTMILAMVLVMVLMVLLFVNGMCCVLYCNEDNNISLHVVMTYHYTFFVL